MAENRPEKRERREPNPHSINHGDLVQFLRENGITNLDELARFALQQAETVGSEQQLWIAITDKYALLGPG